MSEQKAKDPPLVILRSLKAKESPLVILRSLKGDVRISKRSIKNIFIKL